jgi:histidinol dehydrogenase
MRFIRTGEEKNAFLRVLTKRAFGSSPDIEPKVKAILDDVRRNGDRAVLKYTKIFDSLKTNRLAIKADAISGCAGRADRKVVAALKLSAKRIRAISPRRFWPRKASRI